jgi:ElaB/YqjD/DUF883 family membrane-anchored ribosome-binding protein
MENDPEMIRKQMAETRTSLTQKLESLEQKVVDTVEGASCAVNQTVDNVKGAVHETVTTVKDSVRETVGSVRDAFDISRHVENRPWTMMAGAVAVGFLGGYMLHRSSTRERETREPERRRLGGRLSESDGARRGALNGWHAADGPESPDSKPAPRDEEPGVLSKMGGTFEKELGQLKGLAIGAMFGMIRDLAQDSVPAALEQQVGEVMDGITEKLGGQAIHGRLLTRPEPSHVSSTRQPESDAQNVSDGFGKCPTPC